MINTTPQPFSDAPLARRMLEISPAAVAIVDCEGRILFVNERLRQLLGYTNEELIGRSAELFLTGTRLRDHTARLACSVAHCDDELVGEEHAIVAKCKDGSDILVSVSLHHITGSRGSLLLAHLVRADKLLFDRDLLESEKLAAIAQMIGGLEHESRNALQRAVACLDLLELDLKSNPEQMILSQRIRDSLADLMENYDEVRRYAEPIAVKRQPLKLFPVCQGVLDEIAIERDNFPHRLELSSGSERDDLVYVDREKMKLVFQHLLENAIDAAADEACIEVDSERVLWRDEVGVKLAIRDHGSGFDDISLKQAFEPFYTTKQHGTGLGLAICRRIIEAHSGEIRAANHAHGGAVIEITLPVNAIGR